MSILLKAHLTKLMKNPSRVALSPFSCRTWRADWSMEATKSAIRGAETRTRGSYSDKNEFAKALTSSRNDFTEESMAELNNLITVQDYVDENSKPVEKITDREAWLKNCYGVQVRALGLVGLRSLESFLPNGGFGFWYALLAKFLIVRCKCFVDAGVEEVWKKRQSVENLTIGPAAFSIRAPFFCFI